MGCLGAKPRYLCHTDRSSRHCQKRVQGSHFAHLKQAAAANQFVIDRRIDPCMSEVFPWEQIPLAHTKMWKNQHAPGNMSVLVSSPRTGLRTTEDVIDVAAR